jgi:hypothetical protein
MRAEAVLFANQASIDDWALEVEGASWDIVRFDTFPATLSGYIAGILALEGPHVEEAPEVVVEVFDDAGAVAGSLSSMLARWTEEQPLPEGVPRRVPFAVPFMTVVKGPTVLKARLLTEGEQFAFISCAVLLDEEEEDEEDS